MNEDSSTSTSTMINTLQKDLQELVNADVITTDTAQRIEQYYQNRKGSSSARFPVVLAILGALLVGSGIVLLVAHNWDEMSLPIKTVFAFLPLAIGQALCVFTLLRKKGNVAWRESSSIILFFAVASCLALVSQIYHITGSLPDFILTWVLLTAPLIYIMRSSLSSLLVIASATWYITLVGYGSIFSSSDTDIPYFYVACMLFIAPHYYQYFRSNRQSNFFHLHNWFLVVSSTIALGAFVGKNEDLPKWVFIGYAALFGIFYVLGRSVYMRGNRRITNPFLIAGVLGSIIIFLLWSYDELWYLSDESHESARSSLSRSVFFYVSLILLAAQVFLTFKLRKNSKWEYDPLGLSTYVFALSVLAFGTVPFIGLLLINAWILVLAMFYIRKGIREDHLGILNFGLVIIASLALLRFFDESIPFVLRGLLFVGTGIGFFVANYLLLRKRKTIR